MSDSTQAANVTAADDFEANRAKNKEGSPCFAYCVHAWNVDDPSI